MRTNTLECSYAAVEQCVDDLCERGCVRVSGYIEALQNNHQPPELARLSDAERAVALDELVSIMAIYEEKCGR